MDISAVERIMKEAGEPQFRVAQATQAVFGQLISDWDEVTTLSAGLKAKLKAEVPISSLELVTQSESTRGDTCKAAFKIRDGSLIETVLMRHKDGRHTVCVSSQAGCPMACAFCATGTMGLKRNLTSEEIIDQVLHFARTLKPLGESVTNMVLMGMGEPLHNYEAVMTALRTLHDPKNFNMGARRMSISTCGLVPGIIKLADDELQLNLAVSLHAPTDELRSKIMPVNRAYPLAKLMPAIEEYADKTKRKVFFEYLLIKGLNDGLDVAEKLADLLQHPLYHVNLIKYHTTGVFETSPYEQRMAFMDVLKKREISVTHRISFGEDIDAACGQLAAKQAKAAA
ncbi:MAG: 23S rRNA (adenine(2503)-C(2))-methyltransferase RlmN [Patescibacteria group bacterium]